MDNDRASTAGTRHVKATDVQRLISNILESERVKTSSTLSPLIARDEPLITTGRGMASYLPDQYRKMRDISRWQEGSAGGRGRWLPEAELFWQQGTFMADWEDDCPYTGSFKSYYPTYNAMSDRQLRGYFTWRAAVRRGNVAETCLSFAYVYLYELICGIGVDNPLDGFTRMREFWVRYREFTRELDKYVEPWLIDYVAYHGLDPSLVSDLPAIKRDRAVERLSQALASAIRRMNDCSGASGSPSGRKGSPSGRKKRGTTIPDLGEGLEHRMAQAASSLSSYRLEKSRFYKEEPKDMRHVVATVLVRLSRYYEKHRKTGLMEGLFGTLAELPYTMFSTAVFFNPARHPDCIRTIDSLRIYTCMDGLWTCRRIYGESSRSTKLGAILRAIDRSMRQAYGFSHLLKEDEKTPRYLQKIIDEEVAARQAWAAEHKPIKISVDLSKLSGIRNAAARTRESLLIDEEREDGPLPEVEGGTGNEAAAVAMPEASRTETGSALEEPAVSTTVPTEPRPAIEEPSSASPEPRPAIAAPSPDAPQAPEPNSAGLLLTREQVAYVRALLAGDAKAAAEAAAASGESEDMLVDSINEDLFDAMGDTVLEFGDEGPRIIEDYRADIEELLTDEH